MKKTPKTSQANGFSLVELVIAMAIAGIFAGMSIVTLGRNLNNEKLKAITRESIAWLENAKKIAIQNDFSCEITIDNSSKTLSFPTSTTNAALDQCSNLSKASLINTNTTNNTNNLKQCSKLHHDDEQTDINNNTYRGRVAKNVYSIKQEAPEG